MPSLVEKLLKSRRIDFGNSASGLTYKYESDVADLVRDIEAGCVKAGLQLVRYVNSSYPYVRSTPLIHWAIIPAVIERPAQAHLLPSCAMLVEFRGTEGQTKRCRAYCALGCLHYNLHKILLLGERVA